MSRHDDRKKDDLDIGAAEALPSRAQVEDKLKSWFAELDSTKIARMGSFYDELIRFNKVLQLIPSSSIKVAASAHFADVILSGRAVLPIVSGKVLHDIGSGSGFPGIIYGILEPAQKIVLVEMDSRKAEFLKQAISVLRLENVSVETRDIESSSAGSIAFGIARNFAPFHKSLMVLRKSFIDGGKLFHLKTDSWATEMAKVPSQLFTYWTPELVAEYRIPESPAKMAVVVTIRNGS